MKSSLPVVVICTALAAVVQSAAASDPIIWTGPTVTFSLDGTQDPTLPQNWDVLNSTVALTRAQIMGMYNPLQESSYDKLTRTSPLGTLWAFSGLFSNPTFTYGTGASAHDSLTFDTWSNALGGTSLLQGNIVNRPGVIYLTATNEYLDVEFTAWSTGGAFAYQRTSPPPSVINSTWNAGSGNWSDAANWSSNPKFPANGTNGTFTATLPTGNATLDVDATINTLTLGGTTGSWNAQVNLADKALVIAASANKTATITTLQDQLLTGKAGNYTGNGITSSLVAANAATMTIALADNADLNLSTFRGQSVDSNSIILVAARNGDATLDNKVNSQDLNVLAAHWQETSGALWSAGDFNGDGKVNSQDLNVLAANWQFAGSLESALAMYPQFAGVSVPEPASIALASLAIPLLLRRRDRSRS